VSALEERLRSMRLYVLVTGALAKRPAEEAAAAALAGGADAVQMREKDLPDRELIRLGRDLRRVTEAAGALFFVNDRPDIARLVGADGVHLGQDDLPMEAGRRVLGAGGLVGVSTHSVEQARAAQGADYIGVGPMYATATKGYEQGHGPDLVRAVRAAVTAPIVAIGGITPPRAAAVLEAGADAVAVCWGIIAQPDVEKAARAFRAEIDRLGR